MLTSSLLFKQVSSGELDYSLTIEESVEQGRLIIGLDNKQDETDELKYFGLKFKKQNNEYIRSKAAKIGNRILKESFGIKGSLGTAITWSAREDQRKVIFLGSLGAPDQSSRVTYNHFSNDGVSWSPKRDKIIYTAHTAKGTTILVQQIYPFRSKAIQVFKEWGKASGSFWAADGSVFMTLHVSKQNSDIYQFSLPEDPYQEADPNLKKMRKWTFNKTIDTDAHVSPDGKYLAYVSDQTGSPQIYLIDLKNGKSKRITKKGGYNVTPAWSPDSRFLAYSGVRQGVSSLFRIQINNGQEKRLTNAKIRIEAPTWSPDGSLIAFAGQKEKYGVSKIYYVLSSGGAFQRLTNSSAQIHETSPSWRPAAN